MFSSASSPKGKVKVTTDPKYTQYFWGDISEIAGKYVWLLERNQEGDCLCFVDGKGLVDIDHRDIVSR
jgi:hypothetical protein